MQSWQWGTGRECAGYDMIVTITGTYIKKENFDILIDDQICDYGKAKEK